MAYLLELFRQIEKKDLAEKLTKDIVTFQQVSLLFRNFKEYKYLSSFYKKYKAAHFIDRIEFYIDGKIFTKVFY